MRKQLVNKQKIIITYTVCHAFIAIKFYSKSVFMKCSIKQILGMQKLLRQIFKAFKLKYENRK